MDLVGATESEKIGCRDSVFQRNARGRGEEEKKMLAGGDDDLGEEIALYLMHNKLVSTSLVRAA